MSHGVCPVRVPPCVPSESPTDVPQCVPSESPTDVPQHVPRDSPQMSHSVCPGRVSQMSHGMCPGRVLLCVPSGSPTDVPRCVPRESPSHVPQCSDGKQHPLLFSLGYVFTCLPEQITEHFLVNASLYVYTKSTISIHCQLPTHPQTAFISEMVSKGRGPPIYIAEGRMESMPVGDSVSLWIPRGWHGAWHFCRLDGWMNRW